MENKKLIGIQNQIGEILIKADLTKNEIFGILESTKTFFIYEYIKQFKKVN